MAEESNAEVNVHQEPTADSSAVGSEVAASSSMGSDALLAMMDASWLDGWKRIIRGLKAPKDSGEHKYARYMLLRAVGPISVALGTSVLLVVLMFTLVVGEKLAQDRELEVTMVTPEEIKLDEVKIEEEIKPPEEITDNQNVDVSQDNPSPASDMSNPSATPGVGVDGDMSTPMVAMAPVMTKSPLIMKGLYGNRTAGGRASAMSAYGGTGAGEQAVIKALRWLKDHQDADGCWKSADATDPMAMTGFALLTFLAHGETPASKEFGKTVEKAIMYIVSHQAANGNLGALGYVHGICTYALSEAYAMTKIMPLREAVEKAMDVMFAGQMDGGGFYYGYARGGNWDMSVCGWQFQAMKAARMAGISNTNLEKRIELSIKYLKTQGFAADGTCAYSGKDGVQPASGRNAALTGAGVLALQLLGEPKAAQVKSGLAFLESVQCQWPAAAKAADKDAKKGPAAPLYTWYYVTQAKFQAGGDHWKNWNKDFAKELTRNQEQDGHWGQGDHGGDVYSTTLCALMLQVYYRYLPTFKHVEETPKADTTVSSDVKIEVM